MREDRQDAIAAAAYRLLEQHGFAATTMQAIAREARASMETFYRWYGDKTASSVRSSRATPAKWPQSWTLWKAPALTGCTPRARPC